MKSFQMKALALATLGLGGLVMAGSAFAQSCPTGITVTDTPAGAWSAKSVNGGANPSLLSIVPGGYDSTSCKLQSTLGNSGAAVAQVRDDSPQNELRYRAQFIFDPTNLSGASGNNQALIFLANAASAHNNILPMVKIQFAGSGGGTTTSGKRIFIFGACETNGTCGTPVTLPNQTGPNRIEIDLTVSASGTLRYWVNDASTTGLLDGNPTGTITLAGGNAGWTGVKTVYMGMSSPTSNYRSVNTNVNAWFDQFDSRRQTFIGH